MVQNTANQNFSALAGVPQKQYADVVSCVGTLAWASDQQPVTQENYVNRPLMLALHRARHNINSGVIKSPVSSGIVFKTDDFKPMHETH